MPDIRELGRRVHEQTLKKDNWKDHDDPYTVALMLRQEADELVESIEQDGEAFDVGSEIADVLYLALKLCEELGFKPDQLLEMKMLRNDMKYPTDVNSNSGGYTEAAKKSKMMWEAMGGDKAFYYAYEVFIAGLPEPSINGNGHKPEEPLPETVIYQAPQT